VTECAPTTAAAPDGPTGVGLLAGEQPGLEVLGRFGLWRRATRAALRAAGHTQTIKPIPLQSAVPGGSTSTTSASTTRLAPQMPGGRHRADHQLGSGQLRPPVPGLPAAPALHHRQGWPHHPPAPHEDELRAARRRAVTRSFQQSYRRWRPMVERSLAWLVADGCRPVPDRGTQRNARWWSLRVAAVNLRRLLVLGPTRQQQAWALA